jgi:hypothetical protein
LRAFTQKFEEEGSDIMHDAPESNRATALPYQSQASASLQHVAKEDPLDALTILKRPTVSAPIEF